MELCWLTCVSSDLNGEELTRSGGVDTLGALLQRCYAVMPRDAAPSLPAAMIETQCLRTFAGMAAFGNARRELVSRQALKEPPGTHALGHPVGSRMWICKDSLMLELADLSSKHLLLFWNYEYAGGADGLVFQKSEEGLWCRPGLVGDIVRCCSLERAAAGVDAALQCIVQMCASAELQVSCALSSMPLSLELHSEVSSQEQMT